MLSTGTIIISINTYLVIGRFMGFLFKRKKQLSSNPNNNNKIIELRDYLQDYPLRVWSAGFKLLMLSSAGRAFLSPNLLAACCFGTCFGTRTAPPDKLN